MITIKDYAREQNVSYEAVRKQIKRYTEELDGHISKKGRLQFLDDYAVEFLNGKRRENPIIVVNQERDDYIKALEAEIRRLNQKLEITQDKLLESQNLASDRLLQLSNLKYLEKENERLETVLNNVEKEVNIKQGEADSYKSKYEETQKELELLKNRGFWEILFNK